MADHILQSTVGPQLSGTLKADEGGVPGVNINVVHHVALH